MRAVFAWLKARLAAQMPPVLATQTSSGDQSPVFRDVGSATANYHAYHFHEAASFDRGHRRIPRQLPDRPVGGHLFGREEELRVLCERLRRGEHSAVVGPAGLGKTALAAEAIRAVIGEDDTSLLASPFPDGIVLLDLYRLKGRADDAWNALANSLIGGDYAEMPARQRAERACCNRRVLIIIEGAEEADGHDTRCRLTELLSVLDPGNRALILTRNISQVVPAQAVKLFEALDATVAGDLFDQITGVCVSPDVRDAVLTVLQGHPLALTWAANLLARGDESPQQLLADWTRSALPNLSDPLEARHTLKWLFERSMRGLTTTERAVLASAGLLAHTEFPLAAMTAAVGDSGEARPALQRLVQSGMLRRSNTRDDHWHFTHVLGYQFARREKGADPELRRLLAGWIHTELVELLISCDRAVMPRILLQTASLLRTDDNQSLWSLVEFCLYDGVDRITGVGHLDMVMSLLNSVKSWMESVAPQKHDDPFWRRERGTLLIRLGGVQQTQGELAAALRSYSDGRDIRLKLAQSDPTNAQWQRDLSISYDQLGGLQQVQGDLAAALRSYSDGRDIRLKLAQSDPTNAQWQRDLSYSLTTLAEIFKQHGFHNEARSYAEKSLAIDERLASLDPSNVTWQNDLRVSRTMVERLRDCSL